MKYARAEIFVLLLGVLLTFFSVFFYSYEESSSLSLFFSILYIALSINRPLDQQLMLVALALPSTKTLNIAGISVSVCICALSVLPRLFRKDAPKMPFLMLLFMLYSLQYYVRFENLKIGVIMPAKAVLNVAFFWYMCNDSKIAKNSFDVGLKSALALYWGIFSSVFASLLRMENFRRLAVIGNDPNMLAVEAAFVMGFICVAYYSSKLSRFFFLTSVPFLCLVVFYCGSRMGWLLMIFVFLFTSFLNLRKIGKLSYFFVLIGITTVLTLNSRMGRSFISRMNTRIENLNNHDNISNGRYDIWDEYIDTFNSDPILWLIGLGDYQEYDIQKMAHNFFFEEVASRGLIGMFMLYMLYIMIFVRQRQHSNYFGRSKIPLLRILPLLIPLIGGLTLHGLTNIIDSTMIYLGVLCLSLPNYSQVIRYHHS